jgi:hypothetical protein
MGVVDFMDMRQGFGEWYVQWTDGCNETFTSSGILTYSENELSHVNLQHLNARPASSSKQWTPTAFTVLITEI